LKTYFPYFIGLLVEELGPIVKQERLVGVEAITIIVDFAFVLQLEFHL
jgi:hypothetical protein